MQIFQHRWWDEVSTQKQITFSIKVLALFFKKIQNNISNAIFRGDYEKTDALNFEKQPPDLFLEKGVLKIWSKFTGKHRCQSVISMKLHGCSPVDLLQIFRTSFYKNTYGSLLLKFLKNLVKQCHDWFHFRIRSNYWKYLLFAL